MNWQTFGHTHTKQILDAAIKSDLLAHAYLFTGPTGIGKRQLAEEFAKKLVDQTIDLTYYDIAISPGVDDVRSLVKLAALTPAGRRKVIIIDHAHLANNAIASSLLKTLEEPAPHTIFILLSDTARLLPTIMSRCQVIAMTHLTSSELAEYVVSKNLSVSQEIIDASGGSVSRLELLASGSDEAKEILETLAALKQALQSGSAQRVMLVQKLADLDEALLQTVIEAWVYEQLAGLYEQPERFAKIQVGLETLKRLSTNVNKKMTLEYFLLNV